MHGCEAGTTEAQTTRYGQITALLLILNTLSAILFIVLVNRPVFDDKNNSPDAIRYATDGVSKNTLVQHINPAGPGSYIWMSLPARFLGSELWVFRSAVLAAWVILGIGVYTFVRCTRGPDYLYACLLLPLVFPHAAVASATVLTEGPSLLFAISGSLFWAYGMSSVAPTFRQFASAVVGGMCLGLAVFCRQYFLALIPAMGLTAGLIVLTRGLPRPSWWVLLALSFVCAILPSIFLVLIWGGFTSPGMVEGVSYHGRWSAATGFNLTRPVIAGFYTAVYLLPLTFPAVFRLTKRQHLCAAMLALLAFGAVLVIRFDLLQWGPLKSGLDAFGRRFGHEQLTLALLTSVAAYNFYAVCATSMEKWRRVINCPYLSFSISFLLFFLAEQIGVGGNIQFYERYMLQPAPFIGLLAFGVIPRNDRGHLYIVVMLFMVSQVMLWRYAFAR